MKARATMLALRCRHETEGRTPPHRYLLVLGVDVMHRSAWEPPVSRVHSIRCDDENCALKPAPPLMTSIHVSVSGNMP